MKNDQIRAAMNTVSPTSAQRAKMRAAIAAQLPEEKESISLEHKERLVSPRRFSWLPAAAVLAVVLLAGGFGISRMETENVALAPAYTTEPAAEAGESFWESQLYRAMMEWNAYLKTYSGTEDNGAIWPYNSFGCENKEMVEKLDSLREKYGLSMMGEPGGTDSMEYVLENTELKGIFKNLSDVENKFVDGWLYPDGSVQMGASTTMAYEDTPRSAPVVCKIFVIQKQTLHYGLLPLLSLDEYDSWEYTTKDGVTLLMAMNEDDAFLFAEGDNVLILIDVGDYYADEARNDMDKASMEAFAETIDFLGLDGKDSGMREAFLNSALYKASVEWNAYVESQTAPDSNVMNAVIAPYSDYHCENDEMMAKLDELCAKYGMELIGRYIGVNDYEKLLEIVCVDSICISDGTLQQNFDGYGSGYYADGSFEFSGSTTMLGEESPWKDPVDFTFYHIRNTTFHDALLEIGQVEEFESWEDLERDGTDLLTALQEGRSFAWEYTTGNGADVLLVLRLDSAFVICQGERSVDLVKLYNHRVGDIVYGEQVMGREAMELFADGFDFTLPPDGGLTSIPDPKAVAKKTLDIYSSPNPESTQVGLIPAGSSLELTRREWVNGREWAFTQHEKNAGWIDLSDVELTYYSKAFGTIAEFNAQTAPTVETTADLVAVAAADIDVRSSPSEESTVVARIAQGTELELIRREILEGTEWAYTESGATPGWINMNDVLMIDREELASELRQIQEQLGITDEERLAQTLKLIEALKAAASEE